MLRGVDILANAVKVTLGPKGRTVAIEKSYGPPRTSKDALHRRQRDRAGRPVREHRRQDGDRGRQEDQRQAGDGTTAATVLAEAIFNEGLRLVAAGTEPVDRAARHQQGRRRASEAIDAMATKCKGKDDYKKIATVSANHEHRDRRDDRRGDQQGRRRGRGRSRGGQGPATRRSSTSRACSSTRATCRRTS